jgi:hypothetical protein
LTSSDTTEVKVPLSVDILAGTMSNTFSVTIEDDTDTDGDQGATITGSATGYVNGVGNVLVQDNARYVVAFKSADEDYVDFGNIAAFTNSSDWSIIWREKIPATGHDGYHFCRGSFNEDLDGDMFAVLDNDLARGVVSQGGLWKGFLHADTYATDVWYDICLQYDASTEKLSMYINGTWIAEAAAPPQDDTANTNPFLLGGQYATPDKGAGDLYAEGDCIIAHLALLQRKLTPAEMAAYDGTWDSSDSDLFFATSIGATDITDASGNGRHGTNGNSPEYYLEDM